MYIVAKAGESESKRGRLMSIENIDTVPWRVVDDARVLAAAATAREYSARSTDIDAFERHGVVLLRGVFADWVEPLRAGLELNLAAPLEYAFPCEATERGEPGRFFDSYCNWQRINPYKDFVLQSCAASMAGQFMRSTCAQLFHDHAFCKEPGTQRPTPWHQDLPYYCVDGRQTVSVYVSLDDAPEDVAVRFVRGSHRWSKLYHALAFSHGDRLGEGNELDVVPDIDAHPDEYDIAAWALAPGDAVLFNFRTLHGTTSAQLKARRRAFSTRWLGDDARYCNRGETSPPYPDISLENGEPMREDWFPVLWRERTAPA